jgi:hypothetical protein
MTPGHLKDGRFQTVGCISLGHPWPFLVFLAAACIITPPPWRGIQGTVGQSCRPCEEAHAMQPATAISLIPRAPAVLVVEIAPAARASHGVCLAV